MRVCGSETAGGAARGIQIAGEGERQREERVAASSGTERGSRLPQCLSGRRRLEPRNGCVSLSSPLFFTPVYLPARLQQPGLSTSRATPLLQPL